MERKIIYKKAMDGHEVPQLMLNGNSYVLGSQYDSTMATYWVNQHVDNNTDHVVIFGLGDQTIIEEIAIRIKGKIIIYEPCVELVKKYKSSRRVFISASETEICSAIKTLLDDDFVETSILLCHPKYAEIYENEWEMLQEICSRIVDDIGMMRGPVRRFYRTMVHNQIVNFPLQKNGLPVAQLEGVWDGDIPMILVSAGPSLKRNAEELRKAKGKALIWAVDAVLPYLMSKDIIPDVIVSTESSKPIQYFADERCKSIPMVVTSNTRHEVLKENNAHKIWGNDHEFINELRECVKIKAPYVVAYTGVATTALAVMLQMGAKKIVFVGQDLAYSEEGDTHIMPRKEGYIEDEKYVVEGYYGGQIQSRYDWCVFREWMEYHISLFPQREFINATEGGAAIQGAKPMKLEKVLEILPIKGYDVNELLNECKKAKITEYQYGCMMQQYKKIYNDIHRIKQLGYDKLFFEMNYRKIPVCSLILVAMKGIAEEDRKVRFQMAVDFVESEIEKAWGLEKEI